MTVAAVVDGEAAVGDADFGQRLAVETAGAVASRARRARRSSRAAPRNWRQDRARPAPGARTLGLASAAGSLARLRRGRRWRRAARPGAGVRGRRCGADWPELRRDRLRRVGAIMMNGRSPPTITLTRPSWSMRIVMLASTSRKLSARGLPISRLVPDNADLGLGRDRHRARRTCRAARCRAAAAPCVPARRAQAACRRLRCDSGCRNSARSRR